METINQFPFYEPPSEEVYTLSSPIGGKIKIKKLNDITVFEQMFVRDHIKAIEDTGMDRPSIIYRDLLSKISKETGIDIQKVEDEIFPKSNKEDSEESDSDIKNNYTTEIAIANAKIEEFNEQQRYYQALALVRFRLIPQVPNYLDLSSKERLALAKDFLANRGIDVVRLLNEFWVSEITHWQEKKQEAIQESPGTPTMEIKIKK